MKQFTLEAGTVIHIRGIPFYLAHDTTFEGHPANIEMVTQQDPDSPNYALLGNAVAYMSRPPLERAIREWWRRMFG